MEEKRAVDKIRESGGYVDVGTSEDGAIVRIEKVADRLLVIKEHAVYEMIFADNIDPERTNENLPAVIQRLIINQGAKSEIVGRILLTAKNIFKPEYLNDAINCDAVLGLSINLLSEYSLLYKEIEDYLQDDREVSAEYERKKAFFQIPSIMNLESRCKTIFQKTDHVEQTLMEIITHFHQAKGFTKQSHFPRFYEILKEKFGETDSYVNFIGQTLYFMRTLRELRNGLDHRLATCRVENFVLKPDGDILSPTIELNHKDVMLERISLGEFLEITRQNMLEIVEVTFALLAAKAVGSSRMQYHLREIPKEKRRFEYVRFSFWIPVGGEGFYCQT